MYFWDIEANEGQFRSSELQPMRGTVREPKWGASDARKVVFGSARRSVPRLLVSVGDGARRRD